jgi:hypothetical protein
MCSGIMVPMTVANDELVAWLLEGDPSIRWRVHRDVLGSPVSIVEGERAKVATEGWGAKLISLQDPDGRWGGGDYTPKWTSTTYTLLHLLWLGLMPGHPAALAGCERLWDWQSRWRVPETCIVSMLVRLTAGHGYAAEQLEDVVGYLLGQQLNDAAGTALPGMSPGSTARFIPASRRSRPSMPISVLAEQPPMRRRRAAASSSCATGYTDRTAPARWQSVAAPASPNFPGGTSTCCVGWSTSLR